MITVLYTKIYKCLILIINLNYNIKLEVEIK